MIQQKMRRGLGAACLAALAAISCSQGEDPQATPHGIADRSEAIQAPLGQAFCEVSVKGKGVKKTEDDYLPRVVACENPDGDDEALKAQAIAARSALYWTVASHGSICDGEACQVYTCNRQPEARHFQAVKDTAGMYLSYDGLVTYGFYVNGSSKLDAACKNNGSSSLDKYITFNAGKTGNNVKQTSLGFIGPPGFGQNRGCMSQFGANCLAGKGKSYTDILKFYYGDDIQVLKAPGQCAQAPSSGGACAKDADCNNNMQGQGVICQSGACKDGCRQASDCSSGTCSSSDGKTAGTCAGAPPALGTPCNSDDDCQGSQGGGGRVCGSTSKRCIIGCHSNDDCGAGGTCDKSNPTRWRCVRRKGIGESCGSDQDCNGGLDGTQRICEGGTCKDSCRGDFDCGPDGECSDETRTCKTKPGAPGGCDLTYPLVKIKGIPTPEEVLKQYNQRGCGSQAPDCMIDVNNIVDAETNQKLSYNHVKLAPNFTLREMTHQSAQVSPYVYVDPALIEALQRARDVHGVIPVTSGFRSPAKQGQVCRSLCGKSSCKNAKGSVTCAQCSNHMDGKAADLKHSSPRCKLATNTCNPGNMHLIYNEGTHLHVDLGKQNPCTYKDITGCGQGQEQGSGPPPESGPLPESGPPGSDPESPAASSGPCLDQLKALGVSFTPTTQRNVIDAVRLTGPLNGVTIADGTGSSTTNQAFACQLVRTLHGFMGKLKAAGVTRIGSLGSYCLRCCCKWVKNTNECRTASDPFPECGSKGLSNHSYGRAIDIRYFTINGTTYDINENSVWKRYGNYGNVDTCGAGIQEQSGISLTLYQLACNNASMFQTFLTPNKNGDHRNHWHVDIGKANVTPSGAKVTLVPFTPAVLPVDGMEDPEECTDGAASEGEGDHEHP